MTLSEPQWHCAVRSISILPGGDYPDRASFYRLRMRREQGRQAGGIAACHAAFGGDAVDPGMAARGGQSGRVAGFVVMVHEAEIELGFRAQLQPFERRKIGVVDARFRYRQMKEL